MYLIFYTTNLKCHEFVVGFRRPGVDFNRILQSDDQELDALVFDNLEMHCSLKVANIDPSVAAFYLLLYKKT
jgi:hypothetical protein